MSDLKTLPYGTWPSPLSAESIASASMRLREPTWDGDVLYWLEGRPQEGGRHVIVRRRDDGKIEDLLPAPFDARTRVHEYGGGSYVAASGTLIFSNFRDNRLYRMLAGKAPESLTAESARRFADLIWDRTRHVLYAVVEDHSEKGKEAKNTLARVDEKGVVTTLHEGHDFYASPRVSPDGKQIAWLTWDHPNLPWDGTELWVASFEAHGNIGKAERRAGSKTECIFQPEWGPDGALYYVAEKTGFANLYRDGELLVARDAEFGQPQWVFAQTTYGFLKSGEIVCTYTDNGERRLGRIDVVGKKLTPMDLPFTDYQYVRASGDRVSFLGGSPTEPNAVYVYDRGTPTKVRGAAQIPLDPKAMSVAKPIWFPTEGGKKAHAFFYPPASLTARGPADEKPPLIVICHGGPTGNTSSTFDPGIQYWTTRGFALVDVNYGGSTGFGREYRERLQGEWGVVDVDDCVNAVRHLAREGAIDLERCAIRGGSAGGYTVLCALTFRDVFRAGASYYGVSDIEALLKDTHKFESRYDHSLIGPLPEAAKKYRERSPIHFVDQISAPVIFFQGLDDKVVPPNQTESMVKALRAKGLETEYVALEGEGHGFRKAENLKRCLETELAFYRRIFGMKG